MRVKYHKKSSLSTESLTGSATIGTMSTEPHSRLPYLLLVVCFLVALGAAIYFAYEMVTLQKNLDAKSFEQTETAANLAATRLAHGELEAEHARLLQTLEELTDDLEDTKRDLEREEEKNDQFEGQIKNLTGAVNTLDKLSKTDEELLQKYSKVYFLNENYIPSRVRQIDKEFILEGKDAQFFHGEALPFLEDMLEAAAKDNIDLKVVSAYRSFDHQQQLKGEYTTVYGTGANTFSADQGYSEHQLGTTVDLTSPAIGGTYTSFSGTEEYQWLIENAHRFGFTLSYPENNTFYIFEPWHWRFVGTDLARALERDNAHFYDWDQRKIDTYLISIFD